MSVRSFFDTNVIVYGDDSSQTKKQARALNLLEEPDGAAAASFPCRCCKNTLSR